MLVRGDDGLDLVVSDWSTAGASERRVERALQALELLARRTAAALASVLQAPLWVSHDTEKTIAIRPVEPPAAPLPRLRATPIAAHTPPARSVPVIVGAPRRTLSARPSSEGAPVRPQVEHPLLCSIPNAQAQLGLGRTVIYREIANGRLRSVKVGARRLVPASALVDYVEMLEAEAQTGG